MEESILTSVKKVLGIAADYTEFDEDILLHINSVFSTLAQLGVGPDGGFMIEDDSSTWDEFIGEDLEYSSVKTYICLKVRLVFDPPTTAYVIDSYTKQIQELEWRLNVHREETGWVDPDPDPTPPLVV